MLRVFRWIWRLIILAVLLFGLTLFLYLVGKLAPTLSGFSFMPTRISEFLWEVNINITEGPFGRELLPSVPSGAQQVGNFVAGMGNTLFTLFSNRGVWIAAAFVGLFLLIKEARKADLSKIGEHINGKTGFALVVIGLLVIAAVFVNLSGGLLAVAPNILPLAVIGLPLLAAFFYWPRITSYMKNTFGGLVTGLAVIFLLLFFGLAALSSIDARWTFSDPRIANASNFIYWIGGLTEWWIWLFAGLVTMVIASLRRQKPKEQKDGKNGKH